MPWAPFSRSRTEALRTMRSWVSCLCSLEYRIDDPLHVYSHIIAPLAQKSSFYFAFCAASIMEKVAVACTARLPAASHHGLSFAWTAGSRLIELRSSYILTR